MITMRNASCGCLFVDTASGLLMDDTWWGMADELDPCWSQDGTRCLFPQLGLLLDFSADVPVRLEGEGADAGCGPGCYSNPLCWTFSPRGDVLVKLPNKEREKAQRELRHWELDAGGKAIKGEHVQGFVGQPVSENGITMAWHPARVKSSAIYVLAESHEAGGVHLIDARLHRRLMTWTSKHLEHIFSTKHPPTLAWSSDGLQLAVVSYAGTVILSF